MKSKLVLLLLSFVPMSFADEAGRIPTLCDPSVFRGNFEYLYFGDSGREVVPRLEPYRHLVKLSLLNDSGRIKVQSFYIDSAGKLKELGMPEVIQLLQLNPDLNPKEIERVRKEMGCVVYWFDSLGGNEIYKLVKTTKYGDLVFEDYQGELPLRILKKLED